MLAEAQQSGVGMVTNSASSRISVRRVVNGAGERSDVRVAWSVGRVRADAAPLCAGRQVVGGVRAVRGTGPWTTTAPETLDCGHG